MAEKLGVDLAVRSHPSLANQREVFNSRPSRFVSGITEIVGSVINAKLQGTT